MVTENLSTLKIHTLTEDQYDRERLAGNIDPTALYLTKEIERDKIAELGSYSNINSTPWALTTTYTNVGSGYASVGSKYYEHGGSTNDAYIKVLKSGVYLISMTGSFIGASATSGGVGYIRFTINDNKTTEQSQQTAVYHYSDYQSRPSITTVKYLNAGDIIRMEASASINGVLKSKGEELLTIYKLA